MRNEIRESNIWERAVDEALVVSNLGCVVGTEHYMAAKAKVNALCAFNEDVGAYFERQRIKEAFSKIIDNMPIAVMISTPDGDSIPFYSVLTDIYTKLFKE